MAEIDVAKSLELLEATRARQKYFKLERFLPYDKQAQFITAGKHARERVLIAANRIGKSEVGAFEMACHLTGNYPSWWPGRKFPRAVRAWAAGVTGLTTRDICQGKLCGSPGVVDDFGSGFIPRSLFVEKPSASRGVANAFDTIQVRHKTGGISTLTFKSYEQGHAKFQGDTVDVIWFDEEPDKLEIYTEAVTRIVTTNGMIYTTFTPFRGMTKLVDRFKNEPSPYRYLLNITMDEAPHLTPQMRAEALETWPAYEHEARSKGVPMAGEGRVFQVDEKMILEDRVEQVPAHWSKLWGIDFGIAHPFAAVLTAWDKDTDTIHVLEAIRVKDQLPWQHVAAMRKFGPPLPVAWPQDGTQRDKGSGEPLAGQYKKHGATMLAQHATHPDGSVSTEAGVQEMLERMQTGRFLVDRNLVDWLDEFRNYHRKEGLIVKIADDLMSATRIAVMMKRYGRTVAVVGRENSGGGPGGYQGWVGQDKPGRNGSSSNDWDPWQPWDPSKDHR